jgi:nucleoside 2-deoxyribosyltransferase
MKKVIYIAGPITGVENYWEPFEKAEDEIESAGFIALTSTRLPRGMSNEQYMRICLAMIDSADAVLFLPDWYQSEGARVEQSYCAYVGKPHDTNLERLAKEVLKNE